MKLPIKIENAGLYGVAGRAAVGKTTILCILASELLINGQKVLFLSNDMSPDNIKNKIKKVFHDKELESNCTLGRVTNLKDDIEVFFKSNKYEVVIIDDLLDRSTVIDYNEIAKKYNCMVIFSIQQRKSFDAMEPYDVSLKTMQLSDAIISINKKNNFSFWQKVKYFIFFWLQKPNITLKVIKNRRGKEESVDVHIDFKNLTIN